MIPPQSHFPWIRGKRIWTGGLALWLLVSTVDKGNAQILLRRGVNVFSQIKLTCCSFYIHHTFQKTKEKLPLCFSFEFSSIGIWSCLKIAWEHWKAFYQLLLGADTRLLSFDVQMRDANLPVFTVVFLGFVLAGWARRSGRNRLLRRNWSSRPPGN